MRITLPFIMVIFFKKKTAYNMRISDWSSDVCSSDLRIFDDCEIVPRASSDGYIGALRRLKDKARLDAIIPTSEPELRLFSRLADGVEVDDLPVVMANRRAMAIGFDKLETAQFIAGLEAPSPWTYSVSDRDPLGYTCILKRDRKSAVVGKGG